MKSEDERMTLAAPPTSNALRESKILVVGDVMLDRYWFGDV